MSDSSTGQNPWSSPGQAATSNDSYSLSTVQPPSAPDTEYLKATGFGFSLPAGAVVGGIQVEVERYSPGGFIHDTAIQIVKGGAIKPANRSAGAVWPTTDLDTYESYGGTSDLWGEAWSAADINSSGFGAAIAAADGDFDIPSVDHMRITVFYSLCGDGVLSAPAEQCDDGNTANGDCCSSTCQFEPNGNPCPSDGNECTDDQCNASGTCTHPAKSGPCTDDGDVCTDDVCSGGACTHPFNTDPCADDGNVCTDNVCSGGACTHPFNSDPCDDGDVCTSADVCAGGVCSGTGICLDAYKCYQGKDLKNPKFQKRKCKDGLGAGTEDQLGSECVDIRRVKFVCDPADVNGAGIHNDGLHLTCYQIKAAKLDPRPSVEVSTQFQTSTFQLKKAKLICVPSTKTILP